MTIEDYHRSCEPSAHRLKSPIANESNLIRNNFPALSHDKLGVMSHSGSDELDDKGYSENDNLINIEINKKCVINPKLKRYLDDQLGKNQIIPSLKIKAYEKKVDSSSGRKIEMKRDHGKSASCDEEKQQVLTAKKNNFFNGSDNQEMDRNPTSSGSNLFDSCDNRTRTVPDQPFHENTCHSLAGAIIGPDIQGYRSFPAESLGNSDLVPEAKDHSVNIMFNSAEFVKNEIEKSIESCDLSSNNLYSAICPADIKTSNVPKETSPGRRYKNISSQDAENLEGARLRVNNMAVIDSWD